MSKTPSTPFVGRARESAVLHDAINAMRVGRGSVVLVSGSAGLGKTALVESACREAAAGGALVLTGRSYDLTETPPYGPWVELLAGYPRDPELPRLEPEVARCGIAGGMASQDDLFAAILGLLREAARRRPIVLFLDDLHWFDRASLDLFRTLARQIANDPILLVGTHRNDDLASGHPFHDLLPAVVREARPIRLALQPLTSDDVWRLVRHRFPLAPNDETRLAAYLFGRTDGHPFFIDEMIHSLLASRVLRAEASHWTLGDLESVADPAPCQPVGCLSPGPARGRLSASAGGRGDDRPRGVVSAVAGSRGCR